MMYTTQPVGDRRQDPVTRITRWVDQVIGSGFHKYRHDERWQPAVNLYEDDDSYYMVADLSGFQADEIDQINLRAEGGALLLTGQRATPAPMGTRGPVKLHLMEIDHGPFTRRLRLPADADIDNIQATYKCGFLWVRIPKRQP